MDADDCARIIEGVAAVLDLLAADGDAVEDPAPIYELLAERCRHVRVALEVMTGCGSLRARSRQESCTRARVQRLGARRSDTSRLRRARIEAGRGLAVCVRRERFRSLSIVVRSVFRALRRDMKKAATVFRWRPFGQRLTFCRPYAFLSARRS